METYDVIVIGSGIGGLSAATALARIFQRRVLVLEQHSKPGGFTHQFQRKGLFRWDVGVHYVGEMEEGSQTRAVLDWLSGGKLEWSRLPYRFDRYHYPGFTWTQPADPALFQRELEELFPGEKRAIRDYFRHIRRSSIGATVLSMGDLLPSPVRRLLLLLLRPLFRLSFLSTQQYLDRHFVSSRLKSLLVSQWGDYGLPPSRSSFGIHSLIVRHYLRGGWYPAGGGSRIAETVIATLERAGGTLLTKQRVEEILVERGRAVGVRTMNPREPETAPREFRAPVVISDAGAHKTLLQLVPESVPLRSRRKVRSFPLSHSYVNLFIGFKRSPEELGFRGENHWIYTSENHDELYESHMETAELPARFCFLSFSSLNAPVPHTHVAEVIMPARFDHFEKWKDQPVKKRDEEYRALKERISGRILRLLESNFPGFQDLVEFHELSTPLTVLH